ncbi:hypothetical protein RRG08_058447 [Elysia crispata]|uniref:DUF6729 domain-containing protein n=1 Tax=Elysia crispata TaxID=231223 RepID=A0AAE0XZ16_9GAST|nr:hypothetical protein RRG08_058447 [Elysia crispata]
MEWFVMMHIPSGAGRIHQCTSRSHNYPPQTYCMWTNDCTLCSDLDKQFFNILCRPNPCLKLFLHDPTGFFLGMPYCMLAFPFLCSQRGCEQNQFSSCGLHKTVCWVIDQVDDYYMGTEYLECGKCIRKVAAWSWEILDQLDPCIRMHFPAVLSYHLALDRRFVAELHGRSLGNKSTKVYRKLKELHSTVYLERVL